MSPEGILLSTLKIGVVTSVAAQLIKINLAHAGENSGRYLGQNRYGARAFLDRSGAIDDGMTVLTPMVRVMVERSGFVLVRSLSGQDHYVIVSRHEPVRE